MADKTVMDKKILLKAIHNLVEQAVLDYNAAEDILIMVSEILRDNRRNAVALAMAEHQHNQVKRTKKYIAEHATEI